MRLIMRRFGLLFLAISSMFMANDLTAADEPTLQAGFAMVDITPRPGTSMAGYYHKRSASATHDPLYAKAMVFDDGQQRVALVSLDLISTTKTLVNESRRLIAEASSKLPPDHVMISATHSHTGPVLSDQTKRYAILGALDEVTLAYNAELPRQIANAVREAEAALKPVTLKGAIGNEPDLGFNRRFFLRDGSVGWNSGKLNPKIVRAAGPTDDSLPVVMLCDKQDKPLAMMANYAIHLDTVGGTEWSADMPATFTSNLQQVFGKEFFVFYATGCCGDVNHIDIRYGYPQKGHGEAARIGVRMAGAALREYPRLTPQPSGKIQALQKIIDLPPATYAPERVTWAKEVVARQTSGSTPAPSFMELVEAFKVLDIEALAGANLKAEVQVITIGEQLAWVSLPGEIFVQLGLDIKAGSPFPITMIHELANGSLGYIPTQQAYAQGNYEVVSARVAQGSGEQLVLTALELLRQSYQTAR